MSLQLWGASTEQVTAGMPIKPDALGHSSAEPAVTLSQDPHAIDALSVSPHLVKITILCLSHCL